MTDTVFLGLGFLGPEWAKRDSPGHPRPFWLCGTLGNCDQCIGLNPQGVAVCLPSA
jgi:hypothetical protein